MKKGLKMLICLVLSLELLFSFAMAEPAGWRLLDSQQTGSQVEIWFATDEQVSAGRLVYNYGGVTLEETQFSTMEGVGYIFVVDTTPWYQSATADPKEMVRSAVSHMSDFDSVAFIGVTDSALNETPTFQAKNDWETHYNRMAAATDKSGNKSEYPWDAVSKALTLAQQTYQSHELREMIIIQITDGGARGKGKKVESLISDYNSLTFPVPYYCLYTTTAKEGQKAYQTLIEKIPQGKMSVVTKSNSSLAAQECVVPYSKLLYKVKLKLNADIYKAQNQLLTISVPGSQKGLTQEGVAFDLNLIPTWTPEPTATPTPSPTPEKNPQFVGPDTGNSQDIYQLQETLIELGFLNAESASGYWDTNTSVALNRYYSMNNISSDRIPARGGMTKELYDALVLHPENVITPTPAPTETPTPSPTPTPTVDPEHGVYVGYDTPERSLIRRLNTKLAEKFYLTLEASSDTSVYTDATQRAVTLFYEENPDLPRPTGGEGITKVAFDALMGSAPAHVTPTPTPVITPDPNPAYISYDTDSQNLAAELNTLLLDRFFVEEPNRLTSNAYNDETDKAVEKFYKYYEEQGVDRSLIPRPSVGRGITEKAFQFLKQSGPIPTATPIPGLRFIIDTEGLRSADAINAAKRLAALGYLQDTVGAIDEAAFRSAVIWFADRNNLIAPDGYVDDTIYQALQNPNARPSEDPPEDIKPGAKEPKDQIIAFQDALKKLEYYRDIQDPYQRGTFDEPTRKAYERFAEINGIAYDGGTVSWENQQKVLTSGTVNPKLGVMDQTRTLLTNYTELFGMSIPNWALFAGGAVILILLAVIIVILARKGKKDRGSSTTEYPNPLEDQGPAGGPNLGGNEETIDLNVGGSDDEYDGEKTVAEEDCVLTLMITNADGYSRDETYNLREGDKLIIGRGSTSNIIMDTEDRTISRSHGAFYYRNKIVSYEDTSSHYSLVDGRRVDNEIVELQQDSRIQIGKSTVQVRWS